MTGYGPCDTFGMQVSMFAKNNGFNITQYILNNKVICEDTGL